MGKFEVSISGLQSNSNEMEQIAASLNRIVSSLNSTSVGQHSSRAQSSIARAAGKLNGYKSTVSQMAGALGTISNCYMQAENKIVGADIGRLTAQGAVGVATAAVAWMTDAWKDELKDKKATAMTKVAAQKACTNSFSGKWNTFIDEMKENYGVDEALKGSGYIGKIIGWVKETREAESGIDRAKSAYKALLFAKDAVKTLKNYRQIGRAVGTAKSMGWWAKKVVGLSKVGKVSTAKNVTTRFINNLKNKTSPYTAKLREVKDTFTGKKGVVKAVAKWGEVAVSGILNYFSNVEEQKQSGGKMSTGRVVAETITETVVDVVLTNTANVVVGAAVSALLPVSAPGIVVVAATGLVLAGVNAGVKALTGKSTTEFISDTILDTGVAVGKAIGKAAGKVTKGIKAAAKWAKKLAFVL